MRTREMRRYEMFVRVCEFGKAHQDRFVGTVIGKYFARLEPVADRLRQYATSGGLKGMQKKLAREALCREIQVISRTARSIARDTPGFDDVFPMLWREADQACLTAGRLVVQKLESQKAQFLAYGMPETFVDDLRALIDNLEQAVREHAAARSARDAADLDIAQALSAGSRLTKILDILMDNVFEKDPVLLAMWKCDRLIDRSELMRKKVVGLTLARDAARRKDHQAPPTIH